MGKVGSRLRLTTKSSSSSGEDKEVIGLWVEPGILVSETSRELPKGVGVGDNVNDADGVETEDEGSEG